MLTETGRVVAIEADGLWIETIRRSTCGVCAAQKGCGHGLLNTISDGKRGYIRVLPGARGLSSYAVGDEVTISLPEEVILRSSFIAYLLPLAGMFAGALAAVNGIAGNEDLLALIGASVGLAAGFALVRWHGARHRRDPDFQPILVESPASLAQPLTLS